MGLHVLYSPQAVSNEVVLKYKIKLKILNKKPDRPRRLNVYGVYQIPICSYTFTRIILELNRYTYKHVKLYIYIFMYE